MSLTFSENDSLFCFFSSSLNSVYLTNNSLAFSQRLQSSGAAGVNSSTHNPPPPPVEMECVRAASVGTLACVFNASLRGGMGMQPVSGSGHIQYAGITPGSSEEMRTSALSLASRAMDKIKKQKNKNKKWPEQNGPSRRVWCLPRRLSKEGNHGEDGRVEGIAGG